MPVATVTARPNYVPVATVTARPNYVLVATVTARPNYVPVAISFPSAPSESDFFFKFCQQYSTLINTIVIKLTFIFIYLYCAYRACLNAKISHNGCKFIGSEN